jgi:hypothetical protein
MEGRDKLLGPDEALRLLTDQNVKYTNDVRDLAVAKGGDVFLYKSDTFFESKDWKYTNYIMRQPKGHDIIHSKENPEQNIYKKTALLVTQEQKQGHKGFKRYSWQLEKDKTKIFLVQFIGDASLSKPVVHGNSKSQQPRQNLLPSNAHKIKITEGLKKPARLYEEMRLTAGNTALDQALFSPASKNQVKNLQRNVRAKRKANEIGNGDNMSNSLRMSQEYDDIQLLVINPRQILVQIHPEMTAVAREILGGMSFQEGGGIQDITYDTLFQVT